MNTLNVAQAAALLFISRDTLYDLARAGKVPAAKIGKAWVFLEVDLLAWVRGQYRVHKPEPPTCLSTSRKGQPIGTSKSRRQTESSLDDLLAQIARGKPRSTTTA
jgi:excisionase family DNA binding protein